jgi:predicted dehydrogenase
MTIRFAVIGLNHNHIYGQVKCLVNAGAEFVSYYAPEPELVAEFAPHYPQAKLARSEEEILEDGSIQVIASAGIPSDRAPLGIRVMQHGKDYMVDKPGFTTLEQLADVRRVHEETGRIYSVYFSERFANPSTVKAGELVHAGAIGRVIQTLGIGPHRMFGHVQRPEWFFQRARFGGILNDIGSHQVDQFFYFTGSTDAEIVASQAGNMNHPDYPEVEDFGDMMLTSDKATGYIRVDWFTPDGLGTWGDGRLFLQGTDGYIELRKYKDIGGRPGENHLFMVDNKGIQYIDCNNVPMPYGPQFLNDVRDRTETAVTHEHTFRVSEIALQAQAQARRLPSWN